MVGNKVIISGSHGAVMRIEWQLAGQNIGGNFSTINWQAYVDFDLADAQLDNGHVNWNGGALYSNNGRVYNYAHNFTNHTVVIGSGSFDIGHDGSGNATLHLDGSIAVFGSGTSSLSGDFILPNIPRYATINSFTVTNVHDEGFNINVAASDTCDALQYSIDGGASWATVGGTFTSQSVVLHDLPSGREYAVLVAVRRQDSGLWTYSGAIVASTPQQGLYLAFMA